jgi:hypothetical protein
VLLQSLNQSKGLNSLKGTHEDEGDGGAADRWVVGGGGAGESRAAFQNLFRKSNLILRK